MVHCGKTTAVIIVSILHYLMGYFDCVCVRFQEHVKRYSSAEAVSSEEYLKLRRSLMADAPLTDEEVEAEAEAPPGVEEDAGADGGAAALAAVAAATASVSTC